MIVGFAIIALLWMLIAGAAVWNAETAVRVRASRRHPEVNEEIEAAARALGARIEDAGIASADGLTLRAWLFHPPAPNGEAVLVLHGFTDSSAGMLPQVGILVGAGYTVLAPDSRGHGRSEGELVSFGDAETDDAARWGEWLMRRVGVDEYSALGQSMGAAVLIELLKSEKRIRAAVAESPFTSFREVAVDRLADRMGTGRWARWAVRPVLELGLWYIRRRYGIDLGSVRPIEQWSPTSPAVLLIHGRQDRAIPCAHSRRIHLRYPARTALWEVPGAGHTEPIGAHPEEYRARVLAWFEGATLSRAGRQRSAAGSSA